MSAQRMYERIADRAEKRHGARLFEVLDRLDADQTTRRDARLGRDDRYLATFTRAVFQAGFQWRVIDRKWPAFEHAFHGFDVGRNAMMSDDDFDRLLSDTTIVRHGAKIAAVQANAVFLSDLAQEHGSAARVFENWPKHALTDLLQILRRRGARLGGATSFNALRSAGIDTFMPWRDVVAGLSDLGIIDGRLSALRDLRAATAFFAGWSDATGHSIARLSQLLALSIGPIATPQTQTHPKEDIFHV